MLIRLYAAMNTPGLDGMGPIDENRTASETEMYGPRARRVVTSPRL